MSDKPKGPCEVCGRAPGERKPRCIRCAERGRDKMLPSCLPGRYLIVDAASKSGWARVEGTRLAVPKLLDVGECSVWSIEPDGVCRVAALDCEALVIEVPAPAATMGVGGPSTLLGMGKAIGIWQRAWRLACRAQRARSVTLEVMTVSWRPVVLGHHSGKDEWKAAALRHARTVHPLSADLITGEEIPDALCLAEYALCSLDLADVVGVRRLAKLGWVEPRGCWVEGRFISTGTPGKE